MDNERFGTVGIRIGAAILDGIISIIIAIPFIIVIQPSTDGAAYGLGLMLTIILWLLLVVVTTVYGASPGKLILGLRITGEDGVTTPIDMPTSARRYLPTLVGLIPLVGGLISLAIAVTNLVFVSNDHERRSVYDRIGGTRVVYANRL